jgi:DNA-binding NarL/FixJ family response regulator
MSSIKVIVVDDHPLLLKGIVDFLENEEDISVIGSCSNGATALQQIKDLQPAVAVLDISMPGMSGLDVLSNLTREDCPTRILFFAAAATSRNIITAMAEGAFGFVQKDSPPQQLLHCIREAAAGRKCIPYELMANSHEKDTITPFPVDKLLTQREWTVMALAAEGLSNKEIARRLKVTTGTAKIHLHHVFRKMGVRSRSALAALVVRNSNDGDRVVDKSGSTPSGET